MGVSRQLRQTSSSPDYSLAPSNLSTMNSITAAESLLTLASRSDYLASNLELYSNSIGNNDHISHLGELNDDYEEISYQQQDHEQHYDDIIDSGDDEPDPTPITRSAFGMGAIRSLWGGSNNNSNSGNTANSSSSRQKKIQRSRSDTLRNALAAVDDTTAALDNRYLTPHERHIAAYCDSSLKPMTLTISTPQEQRHNRFASASASTNTSASYYTTASPSMQQRSSINTNLNNPRIIQNSPHFKGTRYHQEIEEQPAIGQNSGITSASRQYTTVYSMKDTAYDHRPPPLTNHQPSVNSPSNFNNSNIRRSTNSGNIVTSTYYRR